MRSQEDVTLLVAPLAADAQQEMTVHRIGRLIAGHPPAEPDPSLEAFRQGLRDLGYVEGQNLVIEHRSAEGSTERLPHLVAELVQLPVMENLTVASRILGLHLHILELGSPDALDHAFTAMTREGADALLVIPDSLVIDGLHSQIVALAAAHRLPAMYPWKMYVEAGGLISYAQSLPVLWQRAAYYVDRILAPSPLTCPSSSRRHSSWSLT